MADEITRLEYACSACMHRFEKVKRHDPEWFIARLRPCPKCGTAMTVFVEGN